ncbi:acyclic terpene utilization AtuA family protein [Paeniroseomonas aquatica]|uniref:Acyclic terpene utilization AtuA family protein n=1 Tax=Paeniroseomonas aquatica TaxID=373043 RepID=A0ABT8ADA8_9PROT|nr:acyclic terpene utilization AtuA family protein [Paeniroseomonas aquatica]MDN3567802.1 acyclic terpene utilization AtuA family protein [Paeniroseomonas aquatica]
MSVVGRLLDRRLGPGQPLRVLSASGQLGNGIPEAALQAGLAREPHVIGCDMGSIDPGPYYLGAGRMATSPAITRRDLRLAILGARQARVPVLIGTAGTAGAAPHVAATLDLIRGIVREAGISLRIAVIHADMDRAWLKAMAAADRIRAIGAIGALTAAEIDGAAHIVGQMGTEAFLRALAMEPDVILAGRACDTAVFAAVPLLLGYPAGPATHMAKIIECTSLCCTPGGRDAMLGTLHGDHFDLESMNPARAATPLTVAAHSLYEQADPLHVQEPAGTLNVAAARFEALDDRRVRVHGATWTPATQPSIKIEGSSWIGERAVLLAATCDPRVIEHHAGITEGVRRIVAEIMPGETYDLRFRAYGSGATSLFPGAAPMPTPGELFFLVECIAATAELAKAVVGVAKQNLLHFGFPGRLSTGGNIAFPFTPPEIPAGPAYRFSAYHIADCDDLASAFPITLETLR